MTETVTTTPQTDELYASLPADSPIRQLFEGGIHADPYPAYEQMRSRGIFTELVTHVSRYADGLAVLRHPKAGSDARNSGEFTARLASGLLDRGTQETLDLRSFMHQDPPDHTRLRRLVAKAFTRRRVEALRPMIQRLVDEAIDCAAGRGRMDVGADLAYPLPVAVICHLLGLPVERHLEMVTRDRQQLCCFDPTGAIGTDYYDDLLRTRDDDLAYYEQVVADRRRDPGDDLISELIAVRDEGDRLTDDELVNTIRLLFIGGHETTISLIANGMLALLRNPGQLSLLTRRPDLAGQAVEETVRYDAPFQFVARTAISDLHINGTTIPAGDSILVWLAAAGRDPAVFPEPDTFDITRADKRHLGFGSGIHACLGGPLARLEGEIALRTLTQRLVDPALIPDAPPYYHDDAIHALKSLPVTFAGVKEAK